MDHEAARGCKSTTFARKIWLTGLGSGDPRPIEGLAAAPGSAERASPVRGSPRAPLALCRNGLRCRASRFGQESCTVSAERSNQSTALPAGGRPPSGEAAQGRVRADRTMRRRNAMANDLRFRRLRLRNWKNFHDIDIEIQDRMFLVGANAAVNPIFLTPSGS